MFAFCVERMLEDLLSHQLPSADAASIICRTIDRLLDDTLEKKAAVTDQARSHAPRGAGRARAIPAAIRREVWRRDRGRCPFVDQQGRRCKFSCATDNAFEAAFGLAVQRPITSQL